MLYFIYEMTDYNGFLTLHVVSTYSHDPCLLKKGLLRMRAHTTAMPCSHAYNTAPCETCMMELETQRAVLFLCFFVPIGAVIFDGESADQNNSGEFKSWLTRGSRPNHKDVASYECDSYALADDCIYVCTSSSNHMCYAAW